MCQGIKALIPMLCQQYTVFDGICQYTGIISCHFSLKDGGIPIFTSVGIHVIMFSKNHSEKTKEIPVNTMTVQTISAQNKIRAILADALRVSALLCANGSLMQTFLSVTGFSEKQIYIYSSLFQAVNVLTILLCARFADRGDVLKRTAVSQLPGAVLFSFYLPSERIRYDYFRLRYYVLRGNLRSGIADQFFQRPVFLQPDHAFRLWDLLYFSDSGMCPAVFSEVSYFSEGSGMHH